ncbi:MAG: pyridoxamine 5'-phosphate oxidase family protein [Candidatus Dormiibacterota bacterium]
MRKVELPQLGEMLEQPWLATLATYRKNGTVMLSPVWFEYDGADFIVSLVAGHGKERQIRDDPRVTLCIAEEETFPGRVIEVSGTATVGPDVGAEGILRIATRYVGAALARKYVDHYGGFEWLLLRLAPQRIRALDHRDEPLMRGAEPKYLEKDYTAAEPQTF